MLRQLLSATSLFDLPLIATGIFVVIFLTVLVRACQRSRATEYHRLAALPLQDDAHAASRRTP
jgi:hypothetical protein